MHDVLREVLDRYRPARQLSLMRRRRRFLSKRWPIGCEYYLGDGHHMHKSGISLWSNRERAPKTFGTLTMDTETISEDNLLQVIRHFLNQFEAGESTQFDLANTSRILEELAARMG